MVGGKAPPRPQTPTPPGPCGPWTHFRWRSLWPDHAGEHRSPATASAGRADTASFFFRGAPLIHLLSGFRRETNLSTPSQ
ncbi:Hypothetical protein RMHFA_03986 [Roseomonas mucosa]|nr:Hypothetical protein RMHFA_03986 [Roseomonas mucosa]